MSTSKEEELKHLVDSFKRLGEPEICVKDFFIKYPYNRLVDNIFSESPIMKRLRQQNLADFASSSHLYCPVRYGK